MSDLQTNRFNRIVQENLPKRLEMMEVLKVNPLDASLFASKGSGVNTILNHLGRITDFKGIYAFLEDGKVVYLDESAYIIRRVVRQFKGNSKYQMKLASSIVEIDPEVGSTKEALERMNNMKIVLMDLPDNLERQITTLYLQCHFECLYNMRD